MPEPTPAPPAGSKPGGSIVTKRIGPLPLWGWTVIGAGAIGVLLIMRRKSSAKVATPAGGMPLGDFAPGGGGGGGGVGGGGGPTAPAPGPGPSTPEAPSPVSSPAPTSPSVRPQNTGGVITSGKAPAGASSPYTRGSLTATTNALASTIEFATRQVNRAGSGQAVSVTTGFNQTNEAVASALRDRGMTATVYGGQVYAARSSADFYHGLPPAARDALNRLLAGMKAAGQI